MPWKHKSLIVLISMLAPSLEAQLSDEVSEPPALELKVCKRDSRGNRLYGGECGSLTVAENPDAPEGRRIGLNILRLPALRHSGKTPVFIIAGGPGQAATDLATHVRDVFSDINKERDLVFVDQRGTGKSNPLHCDIDQLQYADLSPKKFLAVAIEKHAECVKNFTADLTYYTTPYAVRDLEAVREALGYTQVNLWGSSYGTRVVLEYVRRFSQSVAAAVLDGVAPISLAIPSHLEEDASAALDRSLALCEQQAACAAVFPDLRRNWIALLRKLAKEPQNHTLQHPRTLETYTVAIDHTTISAWARAALYARELVPILPLAMQRATQGSFAELFSIGVIANDGITEGISTGMQAAVLCAEDGQYLRRHPGDESDSQALLRFVDEKNFARICSLYPKGRLSDEYFTPVVSDIPALFLSGRFDPVTPPRWGEQVHRYFSNSRHLVVAGAHHGVSFLGCMPSLLAEFYNSRDPQALDGRCTDDIHPLAAFIDGAGPALAEISDNAGASMEANRD